MGKTTNPPWGKKRKRPKVTKKKEEKKIKKTRTRKTRGEGGGFLVTVLGERDPPGAGKKKEGYFVVNGAQQKGEPVCKCRGTKKKG